MNLLRGTIPAALLAACVTTASAAAPVRYLVSDQPAGVIWQLSDINHDGDALDIGERTLWGDGFVSVVGLTADGQSVLAVEEGMLDGSNLVIRLTDLNGDGDALDTGERLTWADGLDDPREIVGDGEGRWFVTETDDDRVWKLTDLNNDGDALDIGERTLYADGINGATSITVFDGTLIATATNADAIHRLTDLNSDGDALDIGENLTVVTGIDSPVGLLDDGGGGFFFASFSRDTVHHATDNNADGDMLDLAETLSYADSVFGGLDGPWGMAHFDGGGFLLADFVDGQVLHVRDINGDGDALDVGEVSLFADGFTFPLGILSLSPCGLEGDLNCDGFVGIVDLNIVLSNWNQTVPPADPLADPSGDGFVGIADLNTVLGNWNAGTPPNHPGANANIPEPASFIILTLTFLPMHNRYADKRKRLFHR